MISSSRSPRVPSFTSVEISLGLVHMDLPPLTSPSRLRIRMRGMWSQAFRSTPQSLRDPTRTPPVVLFCFKMKSGGITKGKNSARGKRRRKRRAWMGTTRTTVMILARRDTPGNVQGLGRVPQPHRGVCSHTKGSTADVAYRLNLQTAGARVCRSLQKRTLENTRSIPLHPGPRLCLGVPRGAPRTGSCSSPLFNPGPCRPTPLLSFALRAC